MSTVVKPLDPDSARGRDVARELTRVLDDVEEAIAARKAQRLSTERAA